MWFARAIAATAIWLAAFFCDALVLARLGRRVQFRSRTRYILFSLFLGVLGGAAYMLASPKSEPGARPGFFLGELGALMLGMIGFGPYIVRFLNPEREVTDAQKWALWPVIGPFVCGTFLGGITVTVARILC